MRLTAIFQKRGKWYIGWIEEIPGVNTQGRTLREAKANLKDALTLILKTNRALSRRRTKGTSVIRQPVAVPS